MVPRKVVEYLEPNGSAPFARWFARLDAIAVARVATALYRMEQGNLSNVKPVGQGVADTASTSDRVTESTLDRMARC